jgi:hypothetical protein
MKNLCYLIFLLINLFVSVNAKEEILNDNLVITLQKQQKTIERLEIKINKLSSKLDSALLHLMGNSKASSSSVVSSKKREYNLIKINLPFDDYYTQGSTPVGFLEKNNDKVFLVTGNGVFFTIEKKDIINKIPRIELLKTNFHEYITNSNFYSNNGAHSIKDILIKNDEILVSYTSEKFNDCYNLEIIAAKINFEFLEFNKSFEFEECSSDTKTNPHMGGGRMVTYLEDNILLSVGSYGLYEQPQNINSIFGKIINLNLINKKFNIISMGHRNPQGLYYDMANDVIISTEHGPDGGDEVNINLNGISDDIVENYGWPISSYGSHYDGKFRNNAPLKKSHSLFGFIEPIAHFTPSIGISELVKVPTDVLKNDFLIGSLGYSDLDGRQSLHYFSFDKSYERLLMRDVLFIGDRIRDLMLLDDKFLVILLEGDFSKIPSLGIIDLE